MNLDEAIEKLQALRAHWAAQDGDAAGLLVVFDDGDGGTVVAESVEFAFLDDHDDTQCVRLSATPATVAQRPRPRLVHSGRPTT